MSKKRSLAQECFIDKISKKVVDRPEFKVRAVRVRLEREMPRTEEEFLRWQRHLRVNLDSYLTKEFENEVISIEPPLGYNFQVKKNSLHEGEYDLSATYFVLVEHKEK